MRIGIDLGGTNIAGGVLNDSGELLCAKSIPTDAQRPYSEVIHDMGLLAVELAQMAGTSIDSVESVGVGSPGTPHKETGNILYSNNLGWENVPLVQELGRYIPVPIRLDNDANCAALGEYAAGAAKGCRSAVMVTFGTGVGGGIVLDGKIHSGFNSAGGEIGHMVVVSGGVRCTCGRKGCWESYASATALIRMGNDAADRNPRSLLASMRQRDRLNGRLIFDAAQKGDAAANQVIKGYIWYMAEGITNLVNIFQPEAIVLGGGICAQGDYIVNPIREYVAQGVFCKQVALPRMVTATLGNDAGIIGAALL